MPSVGMRRSTRVLGARVLRSGRRLWTEPQHEVGKFIRSAKENEWIDIFDSADGGDARGHRKDVCSEDSAIGLAEKTKLEKTPMEDAEVDKNVDIMCGIVYTRKRKREEFRDTALSEEKRFGKKYFRKQRRTIEHLKSSGHHSDYCNGNSGIAVIATKTSFECGFWIASLLSCVLSYMKRVKIRLRQLSVFLHWKPIYDAYTSLGVLFVQGSLIKNPGKCIILGTRSLIPVFTVDFSAVPFCFMNLHLSLHLRSVKWAPAFVVCSVGVEQVIDMTNSTEANFLQLASSADHADSADILHPVFELPESVHQKFQCNNDHQKIPLKRKRGRPPLGLQTQKTNLDLFSRRNGVPSPASAPTRVLRSSLKRYPFPLVKDNVRFLMKSKGPSYSAANLLITETNKSHREGGAIIKLEFSESSLWSLVVLKDGITRFILTAAKVMTPSSCNPFNNAILWTLNDSCKLEFPNRKDWLNFKELYKQCFDRNQQVSDSSCIPIPGVKLVSFPVERNDAFVMPDLYLSVKDDELVRALVKRTANYDMDSDDELWLEEFNDQLYLGKEAQEVVTPESFELIVDALEKGFHRFSEDPYDEQLAYEFCKHLEEREIVEAVHKYWVKKRRQKQSALIRIFQLYQPRRTPMIPKHILRKKRSFRQRASQSRRDKPRSRLQALMAERERLEQQNLIKVQESKTTADRLEQSALLKRQRAQTLMKNADLLTYKAMVSLRIAEASQNTESQETVLSFFRG